MVEILGLLPHETPKDHTKGEREAMADSGRETQRNHPCEPFLPLGSKNAISLFFPPLRFKIRKEEDPKTRFWSSFKSPG